MNRSQSLPVAFGACSAAALMTLAGVKAGSEAAFSVVVGIAVSIISLIGLTRFSKVVQAGQFGVGSGHRLALLFGAIKLPFVALGLYLATILAGRFPGPLIVAVIMVYFCFVWFVKRSIA